jgi:hypothetical protein
MRAESSRKTNIHQRVIDTLAGRTPDRIPFIDRLELWYTSHCRAGTLPDKFKIPSSYVNIQHNQLTTPDETKDQEMSLTEVHRRVGIGQELMVPAFSRKLWGVELTITLNNEPFYRGKDPVLEDFPRLNDIIPLDKPGTTKAEFITPHGKLTTGDTLLPNMVASGTQPYMDEHILKNQADYKAFEYIIKNAEFIPLFDEVYKKQEEMGGIGFVVPMMSRSPFQQILINCVGEIPLFHLLHDSPEYVEKLLALLDERYLEDIRNLTVLDWPYVEFDDNLDGTMTNPRLFKKYSLLYYQKYTDLLHSQGKKVGSHTDGNIKPLLELLAKSGLDVCESFTPAPVTECTFSEALEAWTNEGPIIWGGIPSPLLEARTSEEEFCQFIDDILETLNDRPIILGVGDMVMGNNLIERVQYIAEKIA